MVLFDPGVEHRIMVCVTPQRSCERLIERGAARAKEFGGQFVVTYVNNKKDLNRELKQEKILLELFEKAKNLGGNVSILSGDRIYDTLSQFAMKNEVTWIIVGKPPKSAIGMTGNGEVINPLIKAVEENRIQVEII